MMQETPKKSAKFLAYLDKKSPTPQSRYAMLSTMIITLVFAAFVLLVLIFEQLPGELDMTSSRLYSLAPASKNLLKTVDQKISLSLVWDEAIEKEYGLEDMFVQVDNFLDLYPQANAQIEYRVVDPLVHPEMLSAYIQDEDKMGHGSIIVSSERFHRIIPFETWVGFYGKKRISFNVESPVSHAILYVNTGKIPKIYAITAHDETKVADLIDSTGQTFAQSLLAANYEIQPLALNIKEIPTDADAVMILGPKTDFSLVDIAPLDRYIARGGAIWMHWVYTGKTQPQLDRLFSDYGYGVRIRGFVAEQNEERLIPNLKANPLYFLAQPQSFEITKDLLGVDQFIVVGQAVGFQTASQSSPNVKIFPLLKTSDQAVLFDRGSDGKLLRIVENQEIPLAYAIIEDHEGNKASKQTRIFMTTGDLNLMSSFPSISHFYLNGLSWLTHGPETLDIPSKNLASPPLHLSASQFVLLGFLFIIVIPILIFVAGFAVWKRRRLM